MPAQRISAPFPSDVARILSRIGSRKRIAYVSHERPGQPVRLHSYWDGGSRDEYRAWNANGEAIALPVSGSAFEAQRDPWTPQAGDVLVEFGTFCGKPSTPRVTFYDGEA